MDQLANISPKLRCTGYGSGSYRFDLQDLLRPHSSVVVALYRFGLGSEGHDACGRSKWMRQIGWPADSVVRNFQVNYTMHIPDPQHPEAASGYQPWLQCE
jgi:hypothetical protein